MRVDEKNKIHIAEKYLSENTKIKSRYAIKRDVETKFYSPVSKIGTDNVPKKLTDDELIANYQLTFNMLEGGYTFYRKVCILNIIKLKANIIIKNYCK